MIVLRDTKIRLSGIRFVSYMKKVGKSLRDITNYKKERSEAARFFLKKWKRANNRIAKDTIQKEIAETKKNINKKYM